MAREVFVAALVSLMTKAFAVPAFVRVNDVGVPLSEDSSYNVNARFRPVVVVIVLPALYACCSVTLRAFELQTENSLLAFRQTTVLPTVPERFGILVNVFKTISPTPFGERVKSSSVPVVISVATPLSVSVPVEVIAPEEIVVAPLIAPALVIPPVLLLRPPVTEAPPALTTRPPAEIVCCWVKVFAAFLYATLVRVPAVLMLVPFNKNPVAALTLPVTERLPVVPVSVKVSKVFGATSASVIVSVPSLPAVAKTTVGVVFDNVSGVAFEKTFAWSR